MKFSSTKAPPQALSSGIWVPSVMFPDLGIAYLVRSTKCAEFKQAQRKEMTRIARSGRGALASTDTEALARRHMVNHCLLDWKGYEGDDGKPLPLSDEQRTTLATDPSYYKVFEDIEAAVSRVDEMDEDLKNTIVGNSSST